MKEQSAISCQLSAKDQDRVWGLCGHWEYVEEDPQMQIGTGDCMCLISPHFQWLRPAYGTCDFWKEIEA